MTRESRKERLLARREAKAAARTARATASSPAEAPPPAPRPTFGEAIERAGLHPKYAAAIRALHARAAEDADRAARANLRVISCHQCTAPKGCCKRPVSAVLLEAVPIAHRLVRDGRDTPELRDRLLASASAMEKTPRHDYFRPCVFLDEHERCTVYDDRPFECGVAFVTSPPARCSERDADAGVDMPDMAHLSAVLPRLEQAFVDDLDLIRTDVPYAGSLPRMVLLCLQAWSRRDHVRFLAEGVQAAARAHRAPRRDDPR